MNVSVEMLTVNEQATVENKEQRKNKTKFLRNGVELNKAGVK